MTIIPEKPPLHESIFDKWLNRSQRIVWILLGVAIAGHQTLYASTPNPLLIGLAGLCLGLPLTLPHDKKNR